MILAVSLCGGLSPAAETGAAAVAMATPIFFDVVTELGRERILKRNRSADTFHNVVNEASAWFATAVI